MDIYQGNAQDTGRGNNSGCATGADWCFDYLHHYLFICIITKTKPKIQNPKPQTNPNYQNIKFKTHYVLNLKHYNF